MTAPPVQPLATDMQACPSRPQGADPKATVPSLWAPPAAAAALALARQALVSGFSAHAERLYRLVLDGCERDGPPDLDEVADHARAELAAALLTAGRLTDALAALAGLTASTQAHAGLTTLAEARRASGDPRSALAPARKSAEARPDDADAQIVLGRVLSDLRQRSEAARAFKRALDINPSRADASGGLARTLVAMNDLQAGDIATTQALSGAPDDPDALRAHSALLSRRGDVAGAAQTSNAAARTLFARGYILEARAAFEHAARLAPSVPGYHNDAGTAAYLQRRPKEAVAWISRAVALQPSFARALSNLGAALMESGAYEESEQRLREALTFAPHDPEAHVNLANLLLERRRLKEAETHYRSALAAQSTLAPARIGLGIALFMQERFAEGRTYYEARPAAAAADALGLPLWRGETVEKETSLIVLSEQGLGDTLQFMGAVAKARDTFARVGFVCAPPLRRLARQNLPGVEILAALPVEIAASDRYVNLLSLASMLAPDGALTRPPEPWRPWIKADPAHAQSWSVRLAMTIGEPPDQSHRRPRVGLCWGGGDALRDDWLRSIPLKSLAPLLERRDVGFVSLQIGSKRAELGSAGVTGRLFDLADAISDFADTCALVENLDLVISVDTAVAHLAGAMGKPVWLLNRHASEWRWGLNRKTCDYYPSMRLFNQPAPLEWRPVVDALSAALEEWVRNPAPSPLG